jgi:YD repeat-containing protein
VAKPDLEQADLVGPVRTARREYADWQPEQCTWSARRRVDELVFTPEGRIAESTIHNHGGSLSRTTCTYDPAGRLTETRFTFGDSSSRTLYSYDSIGRPTATFVIHPDASRQQSEKTEFDPTGRRVRVQFLDLGMSASMPMAWMVPSSRTGFLTPPR